MRLLLPIAFLLLSGCVAQWPAGSYNDLAKGADGEAVVSAISECTANLVPNHALIKLDVTAADTLSLLMPEALSRQGLQANPAGLPVSYVVASTSPESAFVRVTAPHGICAQYFTRDSNGVLQSAGPITVVLQ